MLLSDFLFPATQIKLTLSELYPDEIGVEKRLSFSEGSDSL
jgi:hypothetical protein